MRDLSNLSLIQNAESLVEFMRSDPLDRFLAYSSDLDPSEFDSNGYATRINESVLIVYSLKASWQPTVNEYCKKGLKYSNNVLPEEIALVCVGREREDHGRAIPESVSKLMFGAECRDPQCPLAWAGFEGVCVLREHPEAETASEPYNKGFIAARVGHQSDRNPYIKDSREHEEWWDGWCTSDINSLFIS